MINFKPDNSGFIALMSAILISIILLLIITNLSLTGFYSRSNILDFELKEKSFSLAEACADSALLKLVNDTDYIGGETIAVSGNDTCTIDLTSLSNPRTFITWASHDNAYFTKLKIIINAQSGTVISWEEI